MFTMRGERLKPTASMSIGLHFGTPLNETLFLEFDLEVATFIVSSEFTFAALELLLLTLSASAFKVNWSRLLLTFESLVAVPTALSLVKEFDGAFVVDEFSSL